MDKLTKLLIASVIGITVPTTAAAAQPWDDQEGPATEASESELTWLADFDEAVAAAKSQGKDLLVDFTGSDWCGWCHKLDDEVFSQSHFKDYAGENFVTVALDFPNAPEVKAQVPNPERNAEVRDKYGVSGYPTILLMTADGEVYGRTGYRPNGPESYVEFLEDLRTNGKAQLNKAKSLAKEFEEASEENRMAVYDRAMTAFGDLNPDYMGQDILADVIKEAYEFDADNAKGYKLKATRFLLDAGMGDDEVFAAVRDLDPKNEEGMLELAVRGAVNNASSLEDLPGLIEQIQMIDELGIKDEEIAKELYFNGAYWAWSFTDQPDLARSFGHKLEATAGDDENVQVFLKDLFEDVGREAPKM